MGFGGGVVVISVLEEGLVPAIAGAF